MPRLPIDYQKTLHYKIVCNDLTVQHVYNGATTDFTRRKAQHKDYCRNVSNKTTKLYNMKIYTIIREHGGWDNWTMVLLEYYPCNSKLESSIRERYWYEELNSTMNCQVPNRNHAEYRKEWDKNNQDKIKNQKNKYRANNKDKINEYRANNKDKAKEQRANNKDKAKEQRAAYYQANKK